MDSTSAQAHVTAKPRLRDVKRKGKWADTGAKRSVAIEARGQERDIEFGWSFREPFQTKGVCPLCETCESNLKVYRGERDSYILLLAGVRT